jgi:Mrp family chromosome partitioning ATPase
MQVDARILGVVINRARVRGAEYGSYYHRYYYYYGKEEKKKEELPAATEEKSL